MIRFAPAVASAGTVASIKATIQAPAPRTADVETPAIETRKVMEEQKPAGKGDLLLAELPEVSAPVTKAAKARSPRKPKAKPDAATAQQLDLSA